MKVNIKPGIFTALFLYTLTASAQKPEVGLMLGINHSNLSGESIGALNLKPSIGGLVGFEIRKQITPQLSGRANLLYNMKGAASDNNNIAVNLGYLDIPLMIQFTRKKLYATVGPQVSVCVKNSYTDKEGQGSVGQLVDEIKTISGGYVIATGIRVSHLDFGLRYSTDLSSAVDKTTFGSLRNNIFMLTATILLPDI